jgi:beta-xylosidase-like protein
LQKLPARTFRLETSLMLASAPGAARAGLVVTGDSNAALAVEAIATGLSVALHVDDHVVERAELPLGALQLSVELDADGRCRFGYAREGEPVRYLQPTFVAKPGRWIGTKVGLFALALEPGVSTAHADFDYFRFGPLGVAARD